MKTGGKRIRERVVWTEARWNAIPNDDDGFDNLRVGRHFTKAADGKVDREEACSVEIKNPAGMRTMM